MNIAGVGRSFAHLLCCPALTERGRKRRAESAKLTMPSVRRESEHCAGTLPKQQLGGAALNCRNKGSQRPRFGHKLPDQRLLALATYHPFVAENIPVNASTQTAASNNPPANPPFIRSGHLTAPGFSDHRIYWEEYGSLAGEPVIVMHGGPGAGSHGSSARFFNPQRYRVVLFDQRGCGKSTPSASDDDATPALTDNTTQHLIDDVSALRHELNINGKMHVFGGSWGSTLALAYAIAHPATVQTLILRGVFLCCRTDVDYFFQGNAADLAAVRRRHSAGRSRRCRQGAGQGLLLAAADRRRTGALGESRLGLRRLGRQCQPPQPR